jgi:carbonic anhydrase
MRIGLIATSLIVVAKALDWNYTENGADWQNIMNGENEKYKNCNSSKIQSPVDIITGGLDWYNKT